MTLRIGRLWACGALLLPLLGCASTKSYTPVNFCTKPIKASMARIIVTRRADLRARGTPLKIFDDNQPIGEVATSDKLCWDRYPGKAHITGSMLGQSLKRWRITVNAAANTAYHVSVSYGGKWRLEQ